MPGGVADRLFRGARAAGAAGWGPRLPARPGTSHAESQPALSAGVVPLGRPVALEDTAWG